MIRPLETEQTSEMIAIKTTFLVVRKDCALL